MFQEKELFNQDAGFTQKSESRPNEAHPSESTIASIGVSQSASPVLAVDDDDDNLLLIECALDLIGIRCTTVRTGGEAMELIAARPFSLILLDVVLPDISGIQIIQWLRQHPTAYIVPVIAVTALARSGDRDRIMAAGFTDYLLKPYLLDDLNDLIQRYL